MSAERVWLCWSFDQACPHIESETEGLRTNLRAFVANRPVSYIPIAVFQSDEEARAFAEELRAEFRARYDAKSQERGS
jgi:hypothetical protein